MHTRREDKTDLMQVQLPSDGSYTVVPFIRPGTLIDLPSPNIDEAFLLHRIVSTTWTFKADLQLSSR